MSNPPRSHEPSSTNISSNTSTNTNIRPLRAEDERWRDPPMPGDETAEQALLGCVLEDAPHVLPVIRSLVRPEDFSREKHRLLYQVILDMADQGDPIDVATLPVEIIRRGLAEAVEGVDYVTSLPNLVVSTHDAAYFANTIHDAGVARVTIRLASQLANTSYQNAKTSEILAEVERLREELHERAGASRSSRFGILSDEEMEVMRPVRGILGTWVRDQDIVAIYGKSDSFKTFVAVGMGECFATGLDWYGMPVEQRTVLYIATEAPNTIGERIKAWKQHHGLAGTRTEFYTATRPIDITNREEVAALIAEIHGTLPDAPGVIIIDTFATATSGDEKEAPVVNAAYRGMRMLRDAFGATILYVDHEGKDREKGQTGSQRKQDNADAQIHVENVVGSPGLITVTARKVKGNEKPEPLTLQTKKVTWYDPREQTTCGSLVLVSTSKAQAREASAEARSQRLSRRQRQALDILSDLPSQKGSYGEWWRAVKTADPRFAKSSFDDARRKLAESRLISGTDNEYVSLVQSQNRTSSTVPNRTGTVSTVPYIRDRTTVPTVWSSVETVPADGAEEGGEQREVRERDEQTAPFHHHNPKTLRTRSDGLPVCDDCHPKPEKPPERPQRASPPPYSA